MSVRKRTFILIIALIQLCLLWPIYPLFSDIYPLILGLPLSFAWVVLMLAASFLTMLWYYLTDPALDKGSEPGSGTTPPDTETAANRT
ncbi:MAG: hypothetical protein R3224_03985 [Balneolaceae bacterium]|nr:hypothetical protein [Balneolaceae bacterium]